MRNRFDRQLTELNQDMIQMGHMIGQAIGMAISALNNRDKEQAEKVIDYDDEINEEERIIENLCLKLLLQQQPVARDLRVISSALKMITDMERIGDQAADISEVTLHLIDTKYKRYGAYSEDGSRNDLYGCAERGSICRKRRGKSKRSHCA